MKRFAAVLGALALVSALSWAPAVAFADSEELMAAEGEWLGTVETAAVTGPITVDVITYVPGEATGGAQASVPLGAIESEAVSAPILIGDFWYVPAGWYAAQQ